MKQAIINLNTIASRLLKVIIPLSYKVIKKKALLNDMTTQSYVNLAKNVRTRLWVQSRDESHDLENKSKSLRATPRGKLSH